MYKLKNFTLFCIIGATSSLIDIALLYVGVDVLHIPLLISATFSFILASTNGYLLNQRFTFKHSLPPNFKQYIKFFIVALIGLCLTLILLHILTNTFNMYYMHAKIITVLLVVFWNYSISTLWAFKN